MKYTTKQIIIAIITALFMLQGAIATVRLIIEKDMFLGALGLLVTIVFTYFFIENINSLEKKMRKR